MMPVNNSRVGQKFRILNFDGDSTESGVGQELVCIGYTDGYNWPIQAVDSANLAIVLDESEVEWLAKHLIG